MEILWLNVALCAALATVALSVILYKNRGSSLPSRTILQSFLVGLVIIFPTSIVGFAIILYTNNFPGVWKLIAHAFLAAAFAEETGKFLSLKLIYYLRHQYRKNLFDLIKIAFALGLGFAVLENLMYSFDSTYLLIARTLSAVPVHIITTGIMACYFFKQYKEQSKAQYFGYIEAILFHGFYNFLISTRSIFSFLAIILLILEAIRLMLLYRSLSVPEQEHFVGKTYV